MTADQILALMRAADEAYEAHASTCAAARDGLGCLACRRLNDAGITVADLWIAERYRAGAGR